MGGIPVDKEGVGFLLDAAKNDKEQRWFKPMEWFHYRDPMGKYRGLDINDGLIKD